MQPIEGGSLTFIGWVSIVQTILTPIFVILGWVVVHRLSQLRDDKKRLREELDSVLEYLAELEILAIEYHSSQERNLEKEEKIIRNINRLSKRANRLCILDDSESEVLRRFRASVTLNNFQSAGFKKQDIGSPIVKGIGACSDHLEEVLEDAFLRNSKLHF